MNLDVRWESLGKYDVAIGHHTTPWSAQAKYISFKGKPFTIVPRDLGYKFPGRFKPMQHQLETWRFLIQREKAFCLDGLGLGKTLSAIWAMDYLMKEEHIRRAMVVAPLTICEYVWCRELFQTLPHRHHVMLKGDRKQKQDLAKDRRNQIIIVNPESLSLLDKLPEVDLILVDEFTKFKNARSKRWKALAAIAKNRRLWLMSGTPTPQSPLDAYGPVRLVRPERLSFLRWRDWTMQQVSEFTWKPKPQAEQVVAKWMQPAIRHRVQDCVDLPEKTVIPLEAPLTKAQQQAIEAFKAQAVAEIGDSTITATTAAAVVSKCLQVMGGGVYGEQDGERYVQEVDADPYYQTVEDVVEQADTPVLIFVPFRSAAKATHDHLQKAGYETGLITGDTPTEQRNAFFSAVQQGTIDALVAVAGTMSHGLTLTGSRYVLWACPPYSYEEYDQANARVYRKGQSRPVIIYHLVQNKLATDLFRRLQTREKLQETVLKLLEKNA